MLVEVTVKKDTEGFLATPTWIGLRAITNATRSIVNLKKQNSL